MKISLNWIRDYVPLPDDLDPDAIAHRLTLSTVEVEQVIRLAASLEGCVVASVRSLSPHPDDARLKLVDVSAGADQRRLVCGAANVAVGMKVALALPGARVRGRNGDLVTLSVTTIRGVESAGMLCSGGELGLADLLPGGERDIADLSGLDAPEGTPLAVALGYDDVILDIDNKSLTNRPDLWGHYGIARELAALYELPLAPLPRFVAPTDAGQVAVSIASPDRCLRYTATTVHGVSDGLAPFAIRSRLARVGQRPISLLVDLTNYVMMAVGQPSHAFDLRDVPSAIQVRRASEEEPIALLDGSSHALDEEVLVIANHERPVALAGIMGGEDAIRPDTSDMLLEVACFTPMPIRRTGRRFSLRTESSARFEKGIDPARVEVALGVFQAMLAELQPDATLSAFRDVYPAPPEPVQVTVGVAFLHRRLGKELPVEEMCALLERLGFETQADGERIQVTVPTWRATGDVSLPEDIVEEIARLYGYEALGFVPPQVVLSAPVLQPKRRLDRRLKEAMAFRMGFREVVSYPWVSESLLGAAGLEEEPTLRLAESPVPGGRLAPSLVPQMLGMIARNVRWSQEFRLFEVGRVFHPGSAPTPGFDEKLPHQPRMLCAALVGQDVSALFYQAKAVIEALPREAQCGLISFGPGASPWADPAASLALFCDGQRIGGLGILSSRSKRLAGIRKTEAAVLELNVDALVPNASRENRYTRLPRQPRVTHDISIILRRSVRWEQVMSVLTGCTPALASIAFVDEYTGAPIPDDRRSLTLRLTLGDGEHTLTREEIDAAASQVTARLKDELGGYIRE